MKHLKLKDERGALLILFLITLPFLILLAVYYAGLSLTSYQVAQLDQQRSAAQLAADAGADYAIEQFSQNNSWTSTGGEVALHSDSKMRTTFTASVSGDDTAKTIAVVGKTYRPASATTPSRSVSIYVDLRPVTNGNYSIVAGAGGLFMTNSSKIVGGSVFINGEINMANTAQIGLVILPVDVKVANQRCPNPPNATYPRVCNSGENGQPITTTHSSHIYGQVKATNQTDGSHMSNPGLVAGSVDPQVLPTYDRAAQKAAVANNMTGAAASCSLAGSVTWPANTKITGNVTLKNFCHVTVQGDVWITGTLSIQNTAQMIISNSVGTDRPNIMVDGAGGVNLSSAALILSNLSGTGAEFYTFYSTAPCSPDCVTVTGTDLASSRTVTTISLNNSATGANSIFYAYWSQVQLANSGQIGAIIGQTIQMSNTSAITFGSSVGVGTTVWVMKGYRRQ